MVWHERAERMRRRADCTSLRAEQTRWLFVINIPAGSNERVGLQESFSPKDVVRMDPEALSALYARLAKRLTRAQPMSECAGVSCD